MGAKSRESISLVTSATFGDSNFAVSLTNVLVLLPTSTDDDSHKNFGVPEYHEPLTIKVMEHIEIGKLGSDNQRKCLHLALSDKQIGG